VSLQAKGLFAYIEGKPEGWHFSASRIANEIKEGVSCIESCLRELEESGYLKREKKKNERGHWYSEYTVYSVPEYERALEEAEEEDEQEDNPNPYESKPYESKPYITRTGDVRAYINIYNKKKYNKKKYNIIGTEESAPEIAQPSKEIVKKKPADEVAKVYYETIKTLKLPVRNHNNVRTKINQLKQELGEEDSLKYLQFIIDIYPTLPDDGYKPRILEALDIYSKRVAIGSWVTNLRDKQSGGIAGW
jgi:hypothetical protein